MTRHFLSLNDLDAQELLALLKRASELKAMQAAGEIYEPLKNKTLAMIFEKSSTRTRVSFEAGITQLGGNAIFMAPGDSQLGRGELPEDTARVISGMVDAIVLRTVSHDTVTTFAEYASVPVINGLSDQLHPCQLLADLQTITEHKGTLEGARIAWVGDGNNVCNSWINAANILNFELRIATPKGYEPDPDRVNKARRNVQLCTNAKEAVQDCIVVNTDVWASMGQEDENETRKRAFADFQVTDKLMTNAKSDALFMHCLPAYRGLEVSSGVIDGAQSVVWEQAHNRLHAQKALLEFLLAAG